jgi:hypothetical protein
MTIKHKFVSAVAQGADATKVRTNDWNNTHDDKHLLTTLTANTGLAWGTHETVFSNPSGGDITLTLPTAVGHDGERMRIKRINDQGGDTILATTSSQTIDGLTTRKLTEIFQFFELESDGANWKILAGNEFAIATPGQGGGYFCGYTIQTPIAPAANVFVNSINQVYAYEFVLPFDTIVGNISCELTTAGAAGKKYGIGIYSADRNTKLLETGALAADAALGAKNTVLSPRVTLLRGVYWLAQTTDDVATQLRLAIAANLQLSALNAVVGRYGTAANAAAAGVLPTTLGAVAASIGRGPVLAVFQP